MKYKFFYIGGFLLAFFIFGQVAGAQINTGLHFNVLNNLNANVDLIDPLPTVITPTSTKNSEVEKFSEQEEKNVNDTAIIIPIKKIEPIKTISILDDSQTENIKVEDETTSTKEGAEPVEDAVEKTIIFKQNPKVETVKNLEDLKVEEVKIEPADDVVDKDTGVKSLPEQKVDFQKPVLTNIELPKEEIKKDDEDNNEDSSKEEDKPEVKDNIQQGEIPSFVKSEINLPRIRVIEGEGTLQMIDFVGPIPDDVGFVLMNSVENDGEEVGVEVGPYGAFTIDGNTLRNWIDNKSSEKSDQATEGSDSKKKSAKPELLSSIKPTLIKNDKDLNTYALDITARDEDIESVEVQSGNKVEVVYNKPAKFFGIFPTKIKEKIRVNTDEVGKVGVEVERPWWTIFTSEKDSKQKVKADVENRLVRSGLNNANQNTPAVFAGILAAVDRTLKVGSDKVSVIPVVRTFGRELPSANEISEEGALVSDIDQMIYEAFFGEGLRPVASSPAYLFVDLATQGMLGGVSSEQLRVAGRTAGSGGTVIVQGIDRVLDMFGQRGLTYQRDAFLRSSLVLEVARAFGGDQHAAAFVNQYNSQLASLFADTGLALPVSSGTYMTTTNLPVCGSGNRFSGCVDMALLFQSLSDPRSLASLCQPGNMVLNGVLDIDGVNLYGCPPPSSVCGLTVGENTSLGIPSAPVGSPTQRQGSPSQLRSPSGEQRSTFMSENGLDQQGLDQLCGAHAALGATMSGGTQQCISEAIAQIAHDDLLAATGMAGCMSQALGLGLGEDPAMNVVIDTTLQSYGCGLADDGAGGGLTPEEVKEREAISRANSERKKNDGDCKTTGCYENATSEGDPNRLPTYGASLPDSRGVQINSSADGKAIEFTTGNSHARYGADGKLDVSGRGGVDELRGIKQSISDTKGGVTGDPSLKLRLGLLENEVDKAIDALSKYANNGAGSSLDGAGCNEAMAEMQAAFDQCFGQLENQVAGALGAGNYGAGRIGRTAPGSNPFGGRPGEYGEPAGASDPITACMEQNSSRTHGAGGWQSNGGACGAVLCADGTDNCCAGAGIVLNNGAGQAMQDFINCTEVMCVPGEPCLCGGDPVGDDSIPDLPAPGVDGNPLANSGVESSQANTGFFARVVGAVRSLFGGQSNQSSGSEQSSGEINNSNSSGNPSNSPRP